MKTSNCRYGIPVQADERDHLLGAQGKSAELKKVLQSSQQQLECQVDLSIPLEMINRLAGEVVTPSSTSTLSSLLPPPPLLLQVRGLKEEQLQRFEYLEQCVATTQRQFAQQRLLLEVTPAFAGLAF